MQHIQSASRALALALLAFPLHIQAQFKTANSENITLRFFQTSQKDSCDYSGSDRALTFTTSSIPLIDHCFDLEDLFGGNATQGFVNQTDKLDPHVWYSDGSSKEAGIHWQLANLDIFNSQANYSSLLYRQHFANATNNNLKPGSYADRRVTIYGGKGCTELDPNNDKGLLDWYGFSCWSEDKGSCGTVPYKIASFSLQPSTEKSRVGRCWVFAHLGAATRVYSPSLAMVGALVSLFLAFLLAI